MKRNKIMYKDEHKINLIRFILWGDNQKIIVSVSIKKTQSRQSLSINGPVWDLKRVKSRKNCHKVWISWWFIQLNGGSRSKLIIILYLTWIWCQLCTKIHKTVQTVHYTLQLTWLFYIHLKNIIFYSTNIVSCVCMFKF